MSSAEASAPKAAEFEGAAPILRVRDLRASVEHYVKVLGFKVDRQAPMFASVSRGRCCLFLSEGDQGNAGSWVWIGVTDAAALHNEYRSKGANVRHPPTNYPWAYEMQVEDPDGNVLRLGSEPQAGLPVGEWLDMRCKRWIISPAGEWVAS